MRRPLLLILLCVITTSSKAQLFGFGLGYSFNFISPDSFNYVIDRYNETRTWLDVPMENLVVTRGISINVEGKTGALFYDMGYNWQRARTYGQGTAPASQTLGRRDLRLKMDTYHVSIGGGYSGAVLSLLAGVSVELGNVVAQTRVGTPEEVSGLKWENAVKEFNVYFTPLAQILVGPSEKFVRLGIEPYYRLAPMQVDFFALNQAINPDTYTNDPPMLNASMGGFGFKVFVLLLLSS
jgi:hypothetical protein